MSEARADAGAVAEALAAARAHLLAERTAEGHWVGRLATSALATATATFALAQVDAARHDGLIRGGLDWLAAHVNADGGWGDTVRSRSNINTTALVWAAFAMAPRPRPAWDAAARSAARWIEARSGTLAPDALVETILASYGSDRTFSTPILTLLALGGRLGDRQAAFRRIPALPFELAALPHATWRWLRLPVVSYALPALVAIGQARYHAAPPRCPVARAVRGVARRRTLGVVRSMQPTSGGFLEAVPLTSFVTACLASFGHAAHPVTRDAVRFLRDLVRPDGGWPIDTCLETWVTTQAVAALAAGGPVAEALDAGARAGLVAWLLGQQAREVHPFTHTPPGAWSWMASDGAVPDADDTPSAMVALAALASADDPRARDAAARGATWLLGLQNRDGGIPTFCRGWGRLPFDRSAADLTAHTLRAWRAWRPHVAERLAARLDRAATRAVRYLVRTQRPDGAWLPLWFGNEWVEDDVNPTYGTARVLAALAGPEAAGAAERGAAWLVDAQGEGGGWGGAPGTPESLEETGLAVEALARHGLGRAEGGGDAVRRAVARGAAYLAERTEGGTRFESAPIGFYFAKLWYFERLYPVVFTVAGLGAAARYLVEFRGQDT